MSVCLEVVDSTAYAFFSSSNTTLAYPLNNQNATTFSDSTLAYNITVDEQEPTAPNIKLCAAADNKLFILGDFGGAPGIGVVDTSVFALKHIALTTDNPHFLTATTSFTVYAGQNAYCTIFSDGSELSQACFNINNPQSRPVVVSKTTEASAGSVQLIEGGSFYDLSNDKLQIYNPSGFSNVSFDITSTMTVTNPIDATGQLYVINNNRLNFEALLAVGKTLYYVAQDTEQSGTRKRQYISSTDVIAVAEPSDAGGSVTGISTARVTIKTLNPDLPNTKNHYAYLYLNGRVYFANPTGAHSQDLVSLKESATIPSTTSVHPSGIVPTSTNPVSPKSAPDSAGNNTGAIVGGVVGGLAGIAIIGALFWWFYRRKRREPDAYPIIGESEKLTSHDSSIEKPSSGNTAIIRTQNLPATELQVLDPMVTTGAAIFGGAYQIPQGEQSIFVSPSSAGIQHYAIRTITNHHGERFSLHYFGAESRNLFLRDVSVTRAIGESKAVVRTVDAFQLQEPIRSNAGTFQYLWITAPATVPRQSIDNLIQSPGLFDVTDIAFRAWSTLTLLEAVKDLHSAGYVHLDLRPVHFYYPDPDQVDRWKLSGFESAVKTNHEIGRIAPNAYQAPELTNPRTRADPSADIWSLGWVIFYLLTGKEPQPDERAAIERVSQIDDTYGTLLSYMLHRNPAGRYSARQLADYWKEAQNMEDDT